MSDLDITIRWYDEKFPSEWLDENFFTKSDTESDKVNHYELSKGQWDQFLTRGDIADKNRLHYYLFPDLDGRNFETITSALFDWESQRSSQPYTHLLGAALVNSYLYLFFDSGISEEITGVVVLRPNTDLVVVRTSEDDFADTVYQHLATMLGYSVDESVRPVFNDTYHETFEEGVIERYKRLWIELSNEADQRVNKIQFISESGENARKSERVTEILSLVGAKIYAGQVEASGFEFTQQRSFFFSWKHKRVTFQSRPNESTKLEVSETLDRIRSITLTPPVDRILRIGDTSIRTEVYADQFSSTWHDSLQLSEFITRCAQLEVPDDSSVIVYFDDGGGKTMSFGELQQNPPESSTFVRVNGRESTFTWERSREQSDDEIASMLGVISGDSQPERLADAFIQFTARDFADAATTTLQDLLQTSSMEFEE